MEERATRGGDRRDKGGHGVVLPAKSGAIGGTHLRQPASSAMEGGFLGALPANSEPIGGSRVNEPALHVTIGADQVHVPAFRVTIGGAWEDIPACHLAAGGPLASCGGSLAKEPGSCEDKPRSRATRPRFLDSILRSRSMPTRPLLVYLRAQAKQAASSRLHASPRVACSSQRGSMSSHHANDHVLLPALKAYSLWWNGSKAPLEKHPGGWTGH